MEPNSKHETTKTENLYTPRCIRTRSGIYINVFEPTKEMFNINDIAHATSSQPRFAGHLPHYFSPCGNYSCTYSVGQHMVNCFDYAMKIYYSSPNLLTSEQQTLLIQIKEMMGEYGFNKTMRTILCHDDTESYLIDMPKPIKDELKGYLEVEEKLMKFEAENVHDLIYPLPSCVKIIDRLMLEKEWSDLMLENKKDAEVWFPHQTKQEYLARFNSVKNNLP